MNKTELVSDTLDDLAREAARKLVFDEPMSVNDWDALQSLASFRLLEIDLEERLDEMAGELIPSDPDVAYGLLDKKDWHSE